MYILSGNRAINRLLSLIIDDLTAGGRHRPWKSRQQCSGHHHMGLCFFWSSECQFLLLFYFSGSCQLMWNRFLCEWSVNVWLQGSKFIASHKERTKLSTEREVMIITSIGSDLVTWGTHTISALQTQESEHNKLLPNPQWTQRLASAY